MANKLLTTKQSIIETIQRGKNACILGGNSVGDGGLIMEYAVKKMLLKKTGEAKQIFPIDYFLPVEKRVMQVLKLSRDLRRYPFGCWMVVPHFDSGIISYIKTREMDPLKKLVISRCPSGVQKYGPILETLFDKDNIKKDPAELKEKIDKMSIQNAEVNALLGQNDMVIISAKVLVALIESPMEHLLNPKMILINNLESFLSTPSQTKNISKIIKYFASCKDKTRAEYNLKRQILIGSSIDPIQKKGSPVSSWLSSQISELSLHFFPTLHHVNSSFDNQFIQCESFGVKMSKLLEILNQPHKRTIIFCNSITDCLGVRQELLNHGHSTLFYSFQLLNEQRAETILHYIHNEESILVCTDNGLDWIPNHEVDQIINFSIPNFPIKYMLRSEK